MERKRQLIFFGNYFSDFYDAQTDKVRSKIDYVLFMIRIAEKIPRKFFESITDYEGLYAIRIEYEKSIFRIFCCFDQGNLIVIFNGMQKKTAKTPKKDLEQAMRIKSEYFKQKREGKIK
jgi:phage-related protein